MNATGRTFPVSECYGPVVQGEGLLIGRPTVFIRFGGCDYRCSWCDSLYAVLPQHVREWERLSEEEIVQRVNALMDHPGHVTLSGGNPAMHALGDLVRLLHAHGHRVAIETQGTIHPGWLDLIDDVTLSPKPPSSGNVTPYDPSSVLAGIIRSLTRRQSTDRRTICLKVVVFDDADYAYAQSVHLAYPAIPFVVQIGTDVGVSSAADLLERLSALQDRIISDPTMFDVAALPQLHVMLRGHARGI